MTWPWNVQKCSIERKCIMLQIQSVSLDSGCFCLYWWGQLQWEKGWLYGIRFCHPFLLPPGSSTRIAVNHPLGKVGKSAPSLSLASTATERHPKKKQPMPYFLVKTADFRPPLKVLGDCSAQEAKIFHRGYWGSQTGWWVRAPPNVYDHSHCLWSLKLHLVCPTPEHLVVSLPSIGRLIIIKEMFIEGKWCLQTSGAWQTDDWRCSGVQREK